MMTVSPSANPKSEIANRTPGSRLVLGTMIVSLKQKEQSFALLDAAYANGITTFDLAHVYAGGDAERTLGAWMQERGLREHVTLVDKGCHPNQDRKRVTPFDLASDIHDALARLRTPCIDVYMLHRDDTDLPVAPIVDALNAHLAAGRIRAFGASNWTRARIEEANAYAAARGLAPFTSSSPHFSLAEQVDNPWGPGCVTLTGAAQADDRAWYQRTGMTIYAYSSLARGLLSGRMTRANYKEIADGACQKAYCHEVNFQRLDRATELAEKRGVSVPQLALAYLLNGPLNVHPLIGAASAKEIEECVAAQAIKLSPAELAWLENG